MLLSWKRVRRIAAASLVASGLVAASAPRFAAASQGPVPPADVQALVDLGLEPLDLWIIREAHHFWAARGETIWPDVQLGSAPILLSLTDRWLWIGHPDPPADCVPLPAPLPVLSQDACVQPSNGFVPGSQAPVLRGAATIQAPALSHLRRHVIGSLVASGLTPAQAAERLAGPQGFISTFLHESFHSFQLSERSLQLHHEVDPGTQPPLDTFPYQDIAFNVLLGLQARVVEEAIAGPRDAADLAKDLACIQARRIAALPPVWARFERDRMLLEGTAEYVRYRFDFAQEPDLKPLEALSGDPSMTEAYRSKYGLQTALLAYLRALGLPNGNQYSRGSMDASYIYALGAGMVPAFDRLFPEWKAGFFRKYRSFDQFLADRVPPPSDCAARVEKISHLHDADGIRERAIRQVEEAVGRR